MRKTPVNFESNFKATTPVYPLTVEPTSPDPNDVGLVAPGGNSVPLTNFESNFKATTPVYPKVVEATSADPESAGLLPPERNLNETQLNEALFSASNFKATTPVYPKFVEPTSPNPDDLGLLPPERSEIDNRKNQNNSSPLLDILPPKFDENDKHIRNPNIQTTIAPPSKFYQAPKFDPDFTVPEAETDNHLGIKINNFMKSLTGSQWHNLREQFKIPEYDFPLEENGRPSYEGTLNSFDAKAVKKK